MRRHAIFLVGCDEDLSRQLKSNLSHLKSAVWIGDVSPDSLLSACGRSLAHFPFSKSKNLLGQEFVALIYDGRQGINLDALAIAAGTLQEGGTLLILFNHWQDLAWQPDCDSLRWSGEKYAVNTPHFIAFLQEKITKYGFPIIQNAPLELTFPKPTAPAPAKFQPTSEQTWLLNQMAQLKAEIFIVTAKRGRGKSALAGLFAKQQLQKNQRIILTAPNKSAVKIFNEFAGAEIEFIPPDELSQRVAQNSRQFADCWLFIDEAAMIPLNMLFVLTSTFKRIICTTTIHSYEGTGRGFLLKFIAKIHRTFQHFELTKPLRWQANDKLEAFIDEVLLCDCEDRLPQPSYNVRLAEQIRIVSNEKILHEQIESVYALLTLAHYRTSPLDLRRLFDAPRQQFCLAQAKEELLGCLWAVPEGGLTDAQLIRQIRRGQRRPRGNLVAQMLCFQAGLEIACELRSLRISRISVQPQWQRHGLGKRLIDNLKQSAVDFLSVSFGYTPELLAFWQKCGFILTHISGSKEASSGCYSMVALCPLSEKGHLFTQRAERQFKRNLLFSLHPLAPQFADAEKDYLLNEADWQCLTDFADFSLTLSSALPAIRRLMLFTGEQSFPLLATFCKSGGNIQNKKIRLAESRLEVKKWLQKNFRFL